MRSRPPQILFPHRVADIFAGSENVLGPNSRNIIKKLEENQRFLENCWELPKESFTIDGDLTAVTVTDSPRGKFRIGGRALEFSGTLRDSGASDTDVDLYIAGNLIGTLTFSSGDVEASIDISAKVSRLDTFYVDITSAGTGATGLVVYVHMLPDLGRND